METSNTLLLNNINKGMDVLVSILFGVGLVLAVVLYIWKVSKEGLGKAIYLGSLALAEAAAVAIIVYFIPQWVTQALANIAGIRIPASAVRWVIIYVAVVALFHFMTRKYSGRRGIYTCLIILAILSLGWLYNHWIGMIFISAPILLIFLHVIDKLAQITVPAADPEDDKERRRKTAALLMYLLGIQYPSWAATKKTGRELEMRIAGDYFSDVGTPGLVWTWSHQVVGISTGIEFDKICGPGMVFTKTYERPAALVDLRTQLRIAVVDAITKDGMKVPAVIFIAFAIDREKWPKEEWPRAFSSRIRHFFPDSLELDHPHGSYPYSSGRVCSALSTAGINTSLEDGEKPNFHWDEWVVKQIEQAAREILAERSLDELWRPRNDGPGISALDEIAQALKKLVSPRLAEVGVNLFTARIVNYDFPEDGHVAKQNIKTWSTYWEQQVIEAEAAAEAIYREEIEKAHAFAKSILLDAIAEGLNEARSIREDLPRHVIAQYYVHALEEYIKKQPGLDIAESKKRLEDMKSFLLYNQAEETE